MTPISMTVLSASLLVGLLSPTPQATGAELLRELERMGHTARALYVAAHPDDENTHLLTYLANERGWRAAYLSLTRGEGGQNAIGDQLGHGLGLIRTWELLTARQLDGAEQWISRQRDFGYSKSAEEALEIWGADQALCDVVGVVRRFKPDVLIARFPETGSTHGHHLASARLARAAFEQAGDPTVCAEQLGTEEGLEPWQPARLLYNVPLRWMGGEVQPEWYTVDIGGYDAILGRSHGETAAASRSRHRSQAFGAAARRGTEIEAFELLGGSAPQGEDPFADIPDGWGTRPGGEAVAQRLAALVEAFDPRTPAASIAGALEVYELAGALPQREADDLRQQLTRWVVAAAGVHIDARASDPAASPGERVDVALEVIARSVDDWRIGHAQITSVTPRQRRAAIDGPVMFDGVRGELARNEARTASTIIRISDDASVSPPFWLDGEVTNGAYALPDPALRGRAVGDPPLAVEVTFLVADVELTTAVPVRHVQVDPTLGERVRAFEIVPPLNLTLARDVLLVDAGEASRVDVFVDAVTSVAGARVRLAAPPGWRVEPAEQTLTLEKGERVEVSFEVTAPRATSTAQLVVEAEVAGRIWSQHRRVIDFPHLPPLGLPSVAAVHASALDWHAPAGVIGYVMGTGDSVADALTAAGITVRVLDDAAIATADLSAYAAIIVGPRAFNDRQALADNAARIWDYAANGGRVIVQYQTNNRLQPLAVDVGPAPIVVGRGRVTDEGAPLQWLPGSEGVTSGPNALSDGDFAGWVQERGLYFAESWDESWQPLLAVADPGEDAQYGALLLLHHGDGAVFYTGLSLFRQLPAGHPGAFRLLANLIEYEAP